MAFSRPDFPKTAQFRGDTCFQVLVLTPGVRVQVPPRAPKQNGHPDRGGRFAILVQRQAGEERAGLIIKLPKSKEIGFDKFVTLGYNFIIIKRHFILGRRI